MHSYMRSQRLQEIGVLHSHCLYCFCDRLVQDAFLNSRRIMAVLFAVIQAVDTAPYNSFTTACRPCAAPIGRTAFSADEKLRKRIFGRVFSKLCFCADLLDFSLAVSPCYFFLNFAKRNIIYYRRMVVFNVVLCSFSVVFLDLL